MIECLLLVDSFIFVSHCLPLVNQFFCIYSCVNLLFTPRLIVSLISLVVTSRPMWRPWTSWPMPLASRPSFEN